MVRNLAGQYNWVRFTRYVLRPYNEPEFYGDGEEQYRTPNWLDLHRGWIMPAEDAEPVWYDPRADHKERTSRGEPTAFERILSLGPGPTDDEILSWCADFGLLGLFSTNYSHISWPAKVTATSPTRGLRTREWSGVAIKRLGPEPSNSWDDFCELHFPRGIGPRPLTTDEAAADHQTWRLYAEPLFSWSLAARSLQFSIDAVNGEYRDASYLNGLLAGTGPRLMDAGDQFVLGVASESLLGTLAGIASEQIVGGFRPVVCGARGCGRIFMTDAYQAKYCSRQCQWRERKRRQRKQG